ncbi:hypothetical protein [Pelagicoccus sp. SDUM812002]|uniref:hypothetical protein n=1 Tax=Pelagicoccus sp. SDUM812002 TaxID=3041266 RepID=UPI00280D0C96|nr:hypothetical protein [Pelagicoccus sp. SDUM812002]MDQ8186845.1 hypothetical protein [Pelagicoccus sp. SDUM812002]
MDSERLQKLRQQKQLILDHLDWINQEIDREINTAAPSKSPKTSRLIDAISDDKEVAPSLDLESAPRGQVVSDLYTELGPDTKSAAADTKRGCLIISALAFTALAAVCAWVIYYY